MQADFRAPRRRARVYEELEAPLPVIRSPGEKCRYRAELINQHVLVCHPEHIRRIHNQVRVARVFLEKAFCQERDLITAFQKNGRNSRICTFPFSLRPGTKNYLGGQRQVFLLRDCLQRSVDQTLHELTQKLEIEDVRRELREAEEPKSEDGVCDNTKSLGMESEVEEPEAKKRCRSDSQDLNLDQNSEPSSDSDQDSEPDLGFRVPGPGFVLVVPENQNEGGVREVKRSPLSLTEYLQLSLEEAFFLVYSLGCLSVYLQQEPLSVIQLWRMFRSLRPDFISSYAAYHHFRSRGWVPKGGSGAKYGVDFMLYRKGPPFYHASYSVVVEQTDDEFRGSTLRPFSWRSFAALSRITASVSKELMLCYIVYPGELNEAELDSPVCLSKLKIQVRSCDFCSASLQAFQFQLSAIPH
ncbi:tRNA-splicing endonuclease subunit Sen2 [Oryzias melastigma]|uniref:tRNA-splicing endonuclease subunit Sen2 n=1 Tax=Oryzias melastigma TaxID=30732 RepID=A0A834CMZ5_ORYME|nr:tRNA-splicing endonuclease subunit Sen2 [Oryzias melastigma]